MSRVSCSMLGASDFVVHKATTSICSLFKGFGPWRERLKEILGIKTVSAEHLFCTTVWSRLLLGTVSFNPHRQCDKAGHMYLGLKMRILRLREVRWLAHTGSKWQSSPVSKLPSSFHIPHWHLPAEGGTRWVCVEWINEVSANPGHGPVSHLRSTHPPYKELPAVKMTILDLGNQFYCLMMKYPFC